MHPMMMKTTKHSITLDDMIEREIIPFPDDYDFYDESHRSKFESKVIDSMGNLDIAFETIGLFKRRFRAIMNENHPTWLMMYQNTLNELDLNTIDVKTLSTRLGLNDLTGTSTSVSDSTSSAKGKSNQLDTPQSKLSNVEEEQYITFAERNESENDSSSTATGQTSSKTSSKEDVELHEIGYRGTLTKAELKLKLIESYNNIDKLIMDTLDCLFTHIY